MLSTEFGRALATVIAIIVVTVLAMLLWRRRRKSSSPVLLVGTSSSGKTTLFLRLKDERPRVTFTSITPNDGFYDGKKGTRRIVDIPGQERLRLRFFDQYKDDVKGIIFVIDSTTVSTEVRDVAELLYFILTDPTVRSRCPNVLVLCNKQDSALAKDVTVVQSLLQKELNILRNTKMKQLDGTTNEKSSKVFLGNRKKDFEFSQCKPLKVEFARSDCYKSDSPVGITEVQKWFTNLR